MNKTESFPPIWERDAVLPFFHRPIARSVGVVGSQQKPWAAKNGMRIRQATIVSIEGDTWWRKEGSIIRTIDGKRHRVRQKFCILPLLIDLQYNV
jgi:hypothetical protein